LDGPCRDFASLQSMVTSGTILKVRFKLILKIGQGSFGEIYSAEDVTCNQIVAIKFEQQSVRAVLKSEILVLKNLQNCPHVCRYVHCGRYNNFNYMVMELLGENLSELRRKRTDGKFSLSTTTRYIPSAWLPSKIVLPYSSQLERSTYFTDLTTCIRTLS
jgi:serine/threonine protein kinase